MRNIRSVGVSSSMLVAMQPPNHKAIWDALSDEWMSVLNGKQDLTEFKRLHDIAIPHTGGEEVAYRGMAEAIRWREEALKAFGSYRSL